MATVLLQTRQGTEEALVSPRHEEDGTEFLYCVYLPNGTDVVFTDSYAELLEVLIPNYVHMNEDEQIIHRDALGRSVAIQIQNQILLDPEYQDLINKGIVSPEELRTLHMSRDAAIPQADWWKCHVPLVVVETNYEPFTEVPRPASALSDGSALSPNLFWIRPVEEEDFVISLYDVGFLTILINTQVG